MMWWVTWAVSVVAIVAFSFSCNRMADLWLRQRDEKKNRIVTAKGVAAIGTRPPQRDAYPPIFTTYPRGHSKSVITAATMARWQATYAASQLLGVSDEPEKSTPLEETWSPEKITAYRSIYVLVDYGDGDDVWLGFPHPDGQTEPVVTAKRFHLGKELVAECDQRISGYVLAFGTGAIEPSGGCTESPGENCSSTVGDGCGYYAFKTRGDADAHALGQGRGYICENGVVEGHITAKVLLSGKVIEHEHGYRAEILETVEYMVPERPNDDALLIDLEATARDSLLLATLQSYAKGVI